MKVSPEQQGDRAVAIHANQKLEAGLTEVFKPIAALNKQEIADLNKVLDYNKAYIGEDGKEGNWFASLGEYEKNFKAIIGRQPSEDEALAYFTARQLNDLEYIMTSSRVYAEKARYGTKRFSLDDVVDLETGEVQDIHVEGKKLLSLPDDGHEGGVFIITNKGERVYKDKLQMDVKVHDRIQQMIDQEGYTLIQLANTADKPLRSALGINDPVAFIVARAKAKPLSFDQLPYRAGGHKDYVDPHWVKQMQVTPYGKRWIYEGDLSVYNTHTESEAKRIARALDTARKLLREGSSKFDDFVRGNLPDSPDELKLKFLGDGKRQPIFNIDMPFSTTMSGSKTVHGNAFIDGTRLRDYFGDNGLINPQESPYNIYNQVDKRHTGARDPDAFGIKETYGTDNKPVYTTVKARQLDPVKSLQKSIAKTIRSQHFDDYRIKAVESYIAEFGDLLKKPGDKGGAYSDAELFYDPVRVLRDAEFDTLRHKSPDDVRRINAARGSKAAIENLLNMQTETGRAIDAYFQKLASDVYEKYGQKAAQMIPTEEVSFTRDPFNFLRSMAFHAKESFYNPYVFLVNIQGMVNVMALGKVTSVAKMLPAIITSPWHDINPVALKLVGKKLEAVGWAPGAYEDAYNSMKRYGADIVGRAHAWRDDMADPKFVQHAAGRFLDHSSWFFKRSEQTIKRSAWFVAYDEQLKKTGKTWQQHTKRDYDMIMRQAQTYALNMDRTASSSFQKGIGGMITQFLGYQFRTMELIWGKEAVTGVSVAQRAKLLAAFGALYGVTSPFSAGSGVPFYDIMRQQMIENGIDPNDPKWEWALDGSLNQFVQTAVGPDLNFTQRYGPGGFTQITDLLNSNEAGSALVDIALGAAGQIIIKDGLGVDPAKREIHGGLFGLIRDLAYVTNLEENDEAPSELIVNDFANVLRGVSTANSAAKVYMAANMLAYTTKNGIKIDNTTLGEAITSALTGLDPQSQTDIFTVRNARKGHEKDVKAAEIEIRRMMDGYMKLMNERNYDKAHSYLSLARAYGIGYGLNNFEITDMIRKYMKRAPQNLIDIVKQQWSDPKHAPRGLEDTGTQADQLFPEEDNQ